MLTDHKAENDFQILASFPIFRDLGESQLERIFEYMHKRVFEAEQFVTLTEQPGEVVYFVLNGVVKIQLDQIEGTDMVLAILGPGEVVGEMSFLGDYRGRSANVIPLTRVTLFWMDRQTFQYIVDTMSPVSRNLMHILSDRLRLANDQLRALSSLDVQGRVARQLYLLATQFGVPLDDRGILIPYRLTQSDLGALIGASRERVNRSLGRLRRQRLISMNDAGQVILHQPSMLAQMCIGYLPGPPTQNPPYRLGLGGDHPPSIYRKRGSGDVKGTNATTVRPA